MAVNYISGSSVKNVGGAVSGLSSNGSNIDAVSNVGKSSVTTRAKISDKVTSITQVAGSAVESIQVVNGSFAFRLPSTPEAGTTINITGADYPINGVYLVHAVSGMWALTSTPYHVCGTISASGNYTTSAVASAIDPAAQNEDLIVGYTTSIAGSANDTLVGGGDPRFKRSVHQFVGYRHFVYDNGWVTWDGVMNHCNFSCSGITLGTDDAVTGNPTVIIDTGANVRASDIVPTDYTTGLRAPAQGTVTITDVGC